MVISDKGAPPSRMASAKRIATAELSVRIMGTNPQRRISFFTCSIAIEKASGKAVSTTDPINDIDFVCLEVYTFSRVRAIAFHKHFHTGSYANVTLTLHQGSVK
jgi:hypothetical protein